MNIHIICIVLLSGLILITTGVSAQNLLSLEYSFGETWNNGNVALPSPGSLIIPKGPGILTTTITREPFWRAGYQEGPKQIQYKNYGNPKAGTELGMHLGTTYYQREAVVGSITGATEGLPLTTVSRYYSNLDSEKTLSTRILPAITLNTNHQLPGRIRFTSSWEPIEPGRATTDECDVTGTWRTSRGEINLSYEPYSTALSGTFISQREGTITGTLSGPVYTGTWTEPGSLSRTNSGRFTMLFKDSCCSFTGTWGTGEGDSAGGEWSGIRA